MTLVELLAALTCTGTLGLLLVTLTVRAQRLAHGTVAVAEAAGQADLGADALAGVLAPADPSAGDLLALSDTAVRVLAGVGEAVACAVSPRAIDVAAERLPSGRRLTWWGATPQPGDSVALLETEAPDDGRPATWRAVALASIDPLPGACAATPWLAAGDAGAAGWRLQLGGAVPIGVGAGSLVRVLRPVRLLLYRSAPDVSLGWADWDVARGTWQPPQPIVGGLAPWPSTGALPPGLAIVPRDSAGAQASAAAPGALRSIAVAVAVVPRGPVRIAGRAGAPRALVRRLVIPVRAGGT